MGSGNYFWGVAGWSYPDWKGIVYPADAKRLDELSFIATFFDSIELNNTFYRIPEAKVAESWARRVVHNPRFQFTVKLWQGFTHEKKAWTAQEVKQFSDAIDHLSSSHQLGALLAQFPQSFKNQPENHEKLQKTIDAFRDYPLVVEFRDRSWINADVFQWLEDHSIGFCNVDEPMFRQMIKPSAVTTSPTAYVRFHGRNYQNWYAKNATRDSRYDYLYTDSELDSWVPRLEEMRKKSKSVYVIGNNHFRGQAPANILQLKSKTIRGPVDVPPPMLESFPQLKDIASKQQKKKGQARLFE